MFWNVLSQTMVVEPVVDEFAFFSYFRQPVSESASATAATTGVN
jgi:hypothetical protein